jgi:hypothetical protein
LQILDLDSAIHSLIEDDMKAEDIATYFMRKIAKPIMFDIKLSYDRHESAKVGRSLKASEIALQSRWCPRA